MTSYDVQVWEITKRGDRARSYRVRWAVSGRRFERRFSTKLLADGFRSELVKAARAGQCFDEASGLPEAMARQKNGRSWYKHARAYVEVKWPTAAAKTRRAIVEALTTVTVALVEPTRGAPGGELLRRALYTHGFNPLASRAQPPKEISEALQWVEAASVPVAALARPEVIRRALDACTRRLDGQPAAATTARRKRAVLYNALGYAVERDLLEFNPIDKVQWRTPAVATTVDRRVVANPAQVEAILAELPQVGPSAARLVAFFGCLYYAGMRPSEAASLRASDCHLPQRGWGRVVLSESVPRAGAYWTDDGESREVRGLKRRGHRETRSVPIPPELVRLLRGHIAEQAVAPHARLFRGARGEFVSDSLYDRAWKRARAKALTPEQVASPLVRRPYDLRHAAVSLWLNGGVPATEVARRVGHGVSVLLTVYANCVDGQDDVINERIGRALAEGRAVGRSWAEDTGDSLEGGETAGERPSGVNKPHPL